MTFLAPGQAQMTAFVEEKTVARSAAAGLQTSASRVLVGCFEDVGTCWRPLHNLDVSDPFAIGSSFNLLQRCARIGSKVPAEEARVEHPLRLRCAQLITGWRGLRRALPSLDPQQFPLSPQLGGASGGGLLGKLRAFVMTRLPKRNILVALGQRPDAAAFVAALHKEGAQVIGPAPDPSATLALARNCARLDGAVLDPGFADDLILPIIEALTARGVQLVFPGGTAVPPHPNAPRRTKPLPLSAVKAMLTDQPVGNALLDLLPECDRTRLLPALTYVSFRAREVVLPPKGPLDAAYFPTGGVFSAIAEGRDGSMVETAMIGREGMIGYSLLLGAQRVEQKVVAQIAGEAWRVDARVLRRAVSEGGSLAQTLLAYVNHLILQASETVVANARGTIERRLARRLLMVQDRVEERELRVTHDLLALMLGVRRASVTLALRAMECRGVIETDRGRIIIRDRERLLRSAGDAYSRKLHQRQPLASKASMKATP